MSRKWWFVLAALVVPVAAFLIAERLAPVPIARVLIDLERGRCGVHARTVQIPGFTIHLLEGGDPSGEPVLLLHGVGADKDHFTRAMKPLGAKLHTFSIDLPGFGESTRDPSAPYDITAQAERVHLIARALGLTRFHLGGSSMGGYIALRYAVLYPDEVRSLWLLAPAGVDGAQESPMLADLHRTGRSALFITKVDDFDATSDLVFAHAPVLPYALTRTTALRMVRDEPLHQRILKAIVDSPRINADAARIKAPALIVWGAQDHVLDVSGAAILQAALPRSQLEIMKDVGHLPMLEQPAASAARYLAFVAALPPDQR